MFCTQFFIPLPSKKAKILRLGKKRNEVLCFALDFTYLCIVFFKKETMDTENREMIIARLRKKAGNQDTKGFREPLAGG